jgi:hypothetical protein
MGIAPEELIPQADAMNIRLEIDRIRASIERAPKSACESFHLADTLFKI